MPITCLCRLALRRKPSKIHITCPRLAVRLVPDLHPAPACAPCHRDPDSLLCNATRRVDCSRDDSRGSCGACRRVSDARLRRRAPGSCNRRGRVASARARALPGLPPSASLFRAMQSACVWAFLFFGGLAVAMLCIGLFSTLSAIWPLGDAANMPFLYARELLYDPC